MTKKTVFFLIAISVIFLIIGAANIVAYGPFRTHGNIEEYNNDDVRYIRSAEVLLESGTLIYKNPDKPTVFIMPGIVLTLTPFVALFGARGAILGFKIFQLLLQTANLWLVFLTAKKVFGAKTAVIAVLISATYAADFYSMNVILTETIFKTLLLLLCYTTIIALERRSLKYFCLGGVIWTVAVLFRPTIALFPLVILAGFIIMRYSFSQMVKFSAAVMAIFVIIMLPWWVRNFLRFGQFIPLTRSSGNPMLQGTHINYETDPAEEAMLDDSGLFMYSPDGDEMIDDAVETARAKYRIKTLMPRRPFAYLYWYTIGKTARQWREPFVWEPLFGMIFKVTAVMHGLVVLLFVAGAGCACFLGKGVRKDLVLFLLCIVFYFNTVHLPFYAFARYIYPIMPFAIMFAGYAVQLLTDLVLCGKVRA